MASERPRPIDTTQLGPVRIDHSEVTARRERAEAMLERHSPRDLIAASVAERRRWTIEAMMAFGADEVRRDRELHRA